MKKQATHRDIIKQYLEDMEFLTGLKQMDSLSKDDVVKLIDYLMETVKKHIKWLNVKRLKIILDKGYSGQYGEFYGMNVKTLSKWITLYHGQNQHTITMEVLGTERYEVNNDREKEYWEKMARENFSEKWKEAVENGKIAPLYEWNPWYFDFFEEKGLLVKSDYDIEKWEKEGKRHNLVSGRGLGASLVPYVNERIWKSFIQKCIDQKIDLEKVVNNR